MICQKVVVAAEYRTLDPFSLQKTFWLG